MVSDWAPAIQGVAVTSMAAGSVALTTLGVKNIAHIAIAKLFHCN